MEVISGDECYQKLDLKEYLLFYFGAGWCKPCQEVSPLIQELSTQYDETKIKFFKVDMTDEVNKEFIDTCDVKNIPTFILFKDRNFEERIIGGDIEQIKSLIGSKIGEGNVDKTINNIPNVNKKINGIVKSPSLAPPAPPPPAEPKLEDFYPSETFQGGYEKYEYKKGPKGLGYYLQDDMHAPIGSAAGGDLEVHMVYGSWCGHSRNALPAFEELVKVTDVKTGAGSSVKFVLTEDTSEEMSKFREKVRGFPTYMVVKSDDSMEPLQGHDRSKDSIINAVKALSY